MSMTDHTIAPDEAGDNAARDRLRAALAASDGPAANHGLAAGDGLPAGTGPAAGQGAASTAAAVAGVLAAMPTAFPGSQVSLRMVSSTGVRGHERLFPAERVMIGRRESNQVVLNDMTVSGSHAEIRRRTDAPGYQLADLGSRNGTLIDGVRIESVDLNDGDQIEIGIFRLEFRAVALTQAKPGDAAQQAQLDYLSGGMSGIRQRLERPITRVSASGQVVVIARRKSGWFVTHMEGASRPIVNGQPLGGQARALANNDIIELNTTRIRFRLL